MSIPDELINELAGLCGIIPEYWDIFGNRHATSIETKKAVLRTMKLNIDSDEAVKNEIHAQKARPWNRFIEPVKVISANDQPFKISIHVPVEEREEDKVSISWSIRNEEDQKIDEFIIPGDEITVSDERWIYGRRYIKIDLVCNPPSPPLGKGGMGGYPIGHYSIDVTFRIPNMEISGSSRIIITPDSCYMPPELENGKTWGLSINLYSIRSSRNWGAGDFGDLKKIVQWVSELKAGFVGINPLHAIPNKKPFGISPYSPISRLYKNFIYLDIGNIPEVKELKGQLAIGNRQWEETFKRLRAKDLIDYEKVALLKETILRQAFDPFYEKFKSEKCTKDDENVIARSISDEAIQKDEIASPEPALSDKARLLRFARNDKSEGARNDRIEEFKRYITEEGENLEYFSTYMALSKEFGEGWQEWPEEYRNPYSNAVKEFKNTYKKELMFQAYIQWLIDRQFEEISERAKNLGMSIGIYHDLAIGSIGGGSDAWTAQDIIADRTDLGAPPDDFNPGGQNWGFPPLITEKLKDSGYEYFIQTIRKNMKRCGALRIDHALGMFRQFWIPQGMPASQGAYVRLPSEDLLRIIALESVRNKTIVVAEDLGTVGENARERLLSFGMLSYRLLYFERNYPDPSFLSPERYPDMALCAVTTHDLPTIYGWWNGRDIEVKKRLGMYPDESAWQRNISERERDKSLLIEALKSQGLIPDAHSPIHPFTHSPYLDAMTPELCLAIYEYLARTPCKLVCVSLDDAIGTPDQQNMPGITDSYPSWMQKTPVALEQMISDKWFSDLSEMFKKNNR
ncbi:MAG: 4-alpha-glucanotransferase [Nitrospirae bacterium]|nr:4-alpha-glucanotransferase [Nitrospirota bacterium]